MEALYAYQQAILGGYVEVHNGLAGLRNLQRSLDLKRSEAAVFTRSISTSNDPFRTSRATYLEVLFAQQNALSTRLELVEMKQRELMMGVGEIGNSCYSKAISNSKTIPFQMFLACIQKHFINFAFQNLSR